MARARAHAGKPLRRRLFPAASWVGRRRPDQAAPATPECESVTSGGGGGGGAGCTVQRSCSPLPRSPASCSEACLSSWRLQSQLQESVIRHHTLFYEHEQAEQSELDAMKTWVCESCRCTQQCATCCPSFSLAAVMCDNFKRRMRADYYRVYVL